MFIRKVYLLGTPNLLNGVKVWTFSWTLSPADPLHIKELLNVFAGVLRIIILVETVTFRVGFLDKRNKGGF